MLIERNEIYLIYIYIYIIFFFLPSFESFVFVWIKPSFESWNPRNPQSLSLPKLSFLFSFLNIFKHKLIEENPRNFFALNASDFCILYLSSVLDFRCEERNFSFVSLSWVFFFWVSDPKRWNLRTILEFDLEIWGDLCELLFEFLDFFGETMSSLSRELVFLILQFLEEEKFKESVHRYVC